MLKLATVLDNPGEPLAETRYRDPRQLRELGYNGVVLYETVSLSGVDTTDDVADTELRRWVVHQFDLVRSRIEAAKAQGLDVYLVYDVLTLARSAVDRSPGVYTCKNKPNVLCPASEPALQRSLKALESLLLRLPKVSGVVLRFGDNDAQRLPYLVGNEVYSPHCARCAQLGRADRIVNIINLFHALVVTRLNKRLIARAWNVRPDGMHDSVDLAQRVRDRLPGDEKDQRFILSFKFTQTDFWRYQKWNPSSLVFGNRPILYELECQREFEGKGGLPNWQVPVWRDGPPEVSSDEPTGLANVGARVNLAGLWAWVRGGGWGGPFVKNETWIDANVFAVPRLADKLDSDAASLAQQWVSERLGVTDSGVAAVLRRVLEHSPQTALQAFYIGPFAKSKQSAWHPNADWVQDDLVDAQAAWRIIQRLPESALDQVVLEKQQAAEAIAEDRAALQHQINDRNQQLLEPLVNSLIYGESLLEALRDLLGGLVAYRRFQKTKERAQAELARQRLLSAQAHWQHHTQRHGSLPGAATAFRETHFWELTQKMVGEVTA